MDAQWQQYYWNHYLLQQQHQQQLANPDTTASPPHSRSPHLQPYRHLRPTHSRTAHASGPPPKSIRDFTLHTTTAAHTATTGTAISAGVPTTTPATTPYSRPSHSTTIDLQAQPTTTTTCPRRHGACSTATSHPIPHPTSPRLLEPHRPPLGFQHPCTATNCTVRSNPHSGLGKQEWQGFRPLTSSHGNPRGTFVQLFVEHMPNVQDSRNLEQMMF